MSEPALTQAVAQLGRDFLQKLGEQQVTLGQVATANQEAQTAQLWLLTEALTKRPSSVLARDSGPKIAEADPHFPSWDGNHMSLLHWIVRVQDIMSAGEMVPELAIKYARLALGEYARGHFSPQTTFTEWATFVRHLKQQFLPKKLDWHLAIGLSGLRMNGTDYNSYLSQFVSHVEQMS